MKENVYKLFTFSKSTNELYASVDFFDFDECLTYTINTMNSLIKEVGLENYYGEIEEKEIREIFEDGRGFTIHGNTFHIVDITNSKKKTEEYENFVVVFTGMEFKLNSESIRMLHIPFQSRRDVEALCHLLTEMNGGTWSIFTPEMFDFIYNDERRQMVDKVIHVQILKED